MTLKGKGLVAAVVDFDGCLHHEAVYWKPEGRPYLKAPERYRLFQHVGLLEELLAPYPHVRIVLSTSWVARYGYSETLKCLPLALQERCIGSTLDSKTPNDGWDYMPRGEQVSLDAARRELLGWFALDDDVIGWPEATRHCLVQTDPYEGISPPDIQAAIRKKLQHLPVG